MFSIINRIKNWFTPSILGKARPVEVPTSLPDPVNVFSRIKPVLFKCRTCHVVFKSKILKSHERPQCPECNSNKIKYMGA